MRKMVRLYFGLGAVHSRKPYTLVALGKFTHALGGVYM